MSACGRFADDDDEHEEVPGTETAPMKHQRPQGLGSWSRATITIGAAADSSSAAAAAVAGTAKCQKCHQQPACVVVRQNEPLCDACLEQSVVGKVRSATKGKGLLEEGDCVLLALSGGGASAALLHSMLQLQNRNPLRPERGKVSFSLLVVHVDTSAAGAGVAASSGGQGGSSLGGSRAEAAALAAASVAAAAGTADSFRVLPLESVYEEDDSQLLRESNADSKRQQQQQQAACGLVEAPSIPNPSAHEEFADAAPAADRGDVELACSNAAAELAAAASASHHQQDQQQQGQQQQPQEVNQQDQQRRQQLHRQYLQALLSAIRDPTAKEDTVMHLRQQLLRRAAAAAGCNKLLLGSCASTIAAQVIADAAKGRGFSLPADIQALDCRWGPALPCKASTSSLLVSQLPNAATAASEALSAAAAGAAASRGGGDGARRRLVVLLPLREVSMKEAASLASLRGLLPADKDNQLPTARPDSVTHSSGVNTLAEGFVEAMQANLPASVFTVLRTASNLQAFSFNEPAAAGPAAGAAAAVAAGARAAGSRSGNGGSGGGAKERRGARVEGEGADGGGVVEEAGADAGGGMQFCRVCMAPLPPAAGISRTPLPITGPAAAGAIAAERGLCYGCYRYVLQPMSAEAGRGVEAARQLLEGLLPPKRW